MPSELVSLGHSLAESYGLSFSGFLRRLIIADAERKKGVIGNKILDQAKRKTVEEFLNAEAA